MSSGGRRRARQAHAGKSDGSFRLPGDQKPPSLACARAANARVKEFLRFEQAGERAVAERGTVGRETRDARATGAARETVERNT
jgi:hypothetical protein